MVRLWIMLLNKPISAGNKEKGTQHVCGTERSLARAVWEGGMVRWVLSLVQLVRVFEVK